MEDYQKPFVPKCRNCGNKMARIQVCGQFVWKCPKCNDLVTIKVALKKENQSLNIKETLKFW